MESNNKIIEVSEGDVLPVFGFGFEPIVRSQSEVTVTNIVKAESILEHIAAKTDLWYMLSNHGYVCLHCKRVFNFRLGNGRPILPLIYHVSIHEREGYVAPGQLSD